MAANSEVTANDQRRRLRAYHQAHAQVAEEWKARGYCYPPPRYPVFPADLRGMRCGAKTRAGTPCKLSADGANGRCRLHGGMSTGPKSEAGKRRAAENGKKGGRPRKRNQTP